MYSEGTYVSYRSEGVCIISEIKRQQFGALNKLMDFYILSPLSDPNSKLYVPVDNEELVSKMRPLCTADEINAMALELCDERMEWISDSRQRNSVLRGIIASGDRKTLISLINTFIYQEPVLAAVGKKFTQGDEAILKRAKAMLVEEFSFTTDITTEKALMDVLECKTKCSAK